MASPSSEFTCVFIIPPYVTSSFFLFYLAAYLRGGESEKV